MSVFLGFRRPSGRVWFNSEAAGLGRGAGLSTSPSAAASQGSSLGIYDSPIYCSFSFVVEGV